MKIPKINDLNFLKFRMYMLIIAESDVFLVKKIEDNSDIVDYPINLPVFIHNNLIVFLYFFQFLFLGLICRNGDFKNDEN